MITARKDDVESKLMSIANQRLALSRQSCQASEKYNRALSATKLTITNGSTTTDLTYSSLMAYNAGIANQYLLTDSSSGQVVLSDADAAIFEAAKASSNPYSTFLSRKTGITDATQLATYIKAYQSGAANNSGSQGSTKCLSINDLISALKDENMTSDSSNFGYVNSDSTNYNWSDAYNSDAVIQVSNNKGNVDHGGMNEAMSTLTSILSDMKNVLGTNSNFNTAALSTAYQKTLARFTALNGPFQYNEYPGTSDCPVYEAGGDGTSRAKTESEARNHNSIVAVNNTNFKGHTFYGVSVKNLIDSFFTYYQQSLGYTGDTKNYIVSTTRAGSNYADDAVTKPVNNNASGDSTSNQSIANYYLRQYDAIMSKGYTTNSSVTNKAYFQAAVNNGDFRIQQYSNGNWATASPNSCDSGINSESDEEAVATAKAEYEEDKDKLDYKEEMLDLQKTNLDTERSALDTEIESVQTIINKNIERSFKMFQA